MTTTAATDDKGPAIIARVADDTPPKLLSTGAAARALSIAPRTLQRYLETGIVKPADQTAGGHYRWDVEDLRAQIRRHLDDR